MNKPDTFVLIVAAMAEKLVEKEAQISTYHDEMNDMERTMSDLRQENRRMYDQVDKLPYLHSRNEELQHMVDKLRRQVHALQFAGKSPEETAIAYMNAQGIHLWHTNSWIACIKEVRQLTQWGLKDAKEWCETYIEDNCKDTPPRTLRSSGQVAKAG